MGNQVTTFVVPDGLESTATDIRRQLHGDAFVGDVARRMDDRYVEGQVVVEDLQSQLGSMTPGVGTLITGMEGYFGVTMHGREMSTSERLEAGFDFFSSVLPAGVANRAARAGRRAPLPNARNLSNFNGGRNGGNLVRMGNPSAMMHNPPKPPAMPQAICPPQKSRYPKSPTGKGSVPPSQRDPKRVWTGCGEPTDISNARGHHRQRHADGGPTNNANHDILCVDCHKELHSS